MRKFRVLLDASVIVNSALRDVFFTAAEMDLIDVRFSDDILEETRRALEDKLGIGGEKVAVLLDAIRHAFPFGCVTGYAHLVEAFDLPDPGDRHVLAAAVHSECDALVTFDTKDFPAEAVGAWDLVVLSPDDAIVLMGNDFGSAMASVVRKMSDRLLRPARSVEELITSIAVDAPRGAIVLGAELGLGDYNRLLEDMIVSSAPHSSQNAALRLVGAVLARDVETVDRMIDAAFARQLTHEDQPHPERVLDALTTVFADVVDPDQWGVGSALRTHDVGVELVKFMNMGDGPRVVMQPTWRHGHLLYMRFGEGSWSLVGLDGPDPAVVDVSRDQDPPE